MATADRVEINFMMMTTTNSNYPFLGSGETGHKTLGRFFGSTFSALLFTDQLLADEWTRLEFFPGSKSRVNPVMCLFFFLVTQPPLYSSIYCRQRRAQVCASAEHHPVSCFVIFHPSGQFLGVGPVQRDGLGDEAVHRRSGSARRL